MAIDTAHQGIILLDKKYRRVAAPVENEEGRRNDAGL